MTQSVEATQRTIWTRRAAIAILLVSVLFVTAWALGIGAELDIEVPAETYPPGFSMDFFIKNTGWRTVEFNPCWDAHLERQTSDGWKRVNVEKVCTAELRLFGRGNLTVGGLDLPDDIAPGTYRVVESVDVALVSREFTSATFRVK